MALAIEIMCNIFNWNCNLKSACRYDSITENGTTPPGSGHNHKVINIRITGKITCYRMLLMILELAGSDDTGNIDR